MRFISKVYFDDVIFNSNIVKAYNIYAIENLKLDVDALDNYSKNISLTHPGFEECLVPIKILLNFFFTKKLEVFIEANKNLETFYQVKYESLCKFLMRYKNIKKQSDMKGKITENDLIAVIKKLKELKW
jgi:hypothetical protein